MIVYCEPFDRLKKRKFLILTISRSEKKQHHKPVFIRVIVQMDNLVAIFFVRFWI